MEHDLPIWGSLGSEVGERSSTLHPGVKTVAGSGQSPFGRHTLAIPPRCAVFDESPDAADSRQEKPVTTSLNDLSIPTFLQAARAAAGSSTVPLDMAMRLVPNRTICLLSTLLVRMAGDHPSGEARV